MFKKRTFKTVISIIGIVLVSVILCGVLSRCTDGFTDFEFRELNEDNLVFSDGSDYSSNLNSPLAEVDGFTYEFNNDGVIKFGGELDKKSDDFILSLCTVTLDPGEYTYTCFSDLLSNPSIDTYYSYITYTDSDRNSHVVVADFEEGDKDFEDEAVDFYSTFTLEEETDVNICIFVRSGASLHFVKAMPCLVEGDEPGKFYK